MSVRGVVTFNASRDTTYTTPWAVNPEGATTGAYFYDGNSQVGGFLRDKDGHATTFQYQQGIVPTSINASGTTAGWYGPDSGSIQGLVCSAEGKITPFELPSQVGDSVDIFPRLNPAGEVTGSYTVTNVPNSQSGPSEITYGFLRSYDGKIVSFAVPGNGVFNTAPCGINDFEVATGTTTPKPASSLAPFRRHGVTSSRFSCKLFATGMHFAVPGPRPVPDPDFPVPSSPNSYPAKPDSGDKMGPSQRKLKHT